MGINGTFGVVLRKFNSSLVPIFEKWIQRANPVNDEFSNQFIGDDLVVETDGGFLISGNTAANEAGSPPAAGGGGGAEATIMRVSAAGDLEFVSVLGGPKNEGRTQNSGTAEQRHLRRARGRRRLRPHDFHLQLSRRSESGEVRLVDGENRRCASRPKLQRHHDRPAVELVYGDERGGYGQRQPHLHAGAGRSDHGDDVSSIHHRKPRQQCRHQSAGRDLPGFVAADREQPHRGSCGRAAFRLSHFSQPTFPPARR